MEALGIAQLILTSLLILGVLVGWIRTIKARGEYEANLGIDIKQLKADVTEIKHTIGNGGYVGIKQDIQTINIRCAGDMAAIKADVAALKERING